MAQLDIKLLGGFTAWQAHGPVGAMGRKTQALLAVVALAGGQGITRDKLIGLLWSDRAEAQARASLRQALTELRKALGEAASALVAEGATVRLDSARVEIDTATFARLANERSSQALAEATTLYRGDLLNGLDVRDEAFEDWIRTERERLRGLAVDVLSRLMASQSGEAAIATARHLLALDPLSEPAHRALMCAYATIGNRSAALKQYQTCHDALKAALDTEPEAETTKLYTALKTGTIESATESGSSFRVDRTSRFDTPLLPDKPSIAVLPFSNISGDPEQEYFADGMVEEIITSLSQFRWLFVIARNSSFTYKGRAVNVRQVGRELGVRYVLEGSIRRAANRVRITGQLIDATSGDLVWANRYDGGLGDVFDLQDQVAASVVGAIAPKLEQVEIARSKNKPTDSLDAYDYYLRGMALVDHISKEENAEALRMFGQAIEHDRDFALAYGRGAYCYCVRKRNLWFVDRTREIAEASRLAHCAIEKGKDDAVALCYAGITLAYVAGNLSDGSAFVDRALALNANLAAAWSFAGWFKLCAGDTDAAIEHVARAIRLSPLDPGIHLWRSYAALAYFCSGHYDESIEWAESALRDAPTDAFALRTLTASHALAGRSKDARIAMARLRKAAPQLRLSNLSDFISPLPPGELAKYLEGLRLAGLPE